MTLQELVLIEKEAKEDESCCRQVASVVSDCATPWTAAYQAPPSMGFSRQEYGNGLPLPRNGKKPHRKMDKKANKFHRRAPN